MSNIIITTDRRHNKDCSDWCPLNDGTLTGDPKYCDLSLQCRQIGMKSDWYRFRDQDGNESFDYFCTGMYLNPEKEEKNIDEEVK
jgi:hypothetical protein